MAVIPYWKRDESVAMLLGRPLPVINVKLTTRLTVTLEQAPDCLNSRVKDGLNLAVKQHSPKKGRVTLMTSRKATKASRKLW